MTVPQSTSNSRRPGAPASHSPPPTPIVYLYLLLALAGCTSNRDHQSSPTVPSPPGQAVFDAPREQRNPKPNRYANLPGVYEDPEGKRTLEIQPAPSGRFRFIISAQSPREVFYDAIIDPSLRATQSATNAAAAVTEDIVIEDINTASIRLKRMNTPVPESVLFQKERQ